jgi:hypothetical protein
MPEKSAQQQPGMTDVRALTEADGPTNLAATEDEVCRIEDTHQI